MSKKCSRNVCRPPSKNLVDTSIPQLRIGSFFYIGGLRYVEENIQKTVMMNLRMKCLTKNIRCMTLIQTLSAHDIHGDTSNQRKEKGWTGPQMTGPQKRAAGG